jgi:GMP synthase-like glutamine amidotransferase
MGGSVAPSPKGEIGWTYIWSDRPDLVGNGPWFQFHYDRWSVPAGAVEIARNPVSSQAFTINNALAIQFHPEVTAASLDGWLVWGGDKKVIEDGQDPEIMLAQTKNEEGASRERTYALIDAFIAQIAKR